jgi:hypothetical protein
LNLEITPFETIVSESTPPFSEVDENDFVAQTNLS